MPPPPSANLAEVHRKIDWAEEHLHRLNDAISSYSQSPPYVPVIGAQFENERPDGTTDSYIAVTASRVKPLPESLPLIVGDFLHNLRASVDYLAWQLVLLSGGIPDQKTDFGIWGEGVRRDKLGDPILIRPKPSNDILTLVDGLQPYKSGNAYATHPLYIIHDLNRIDKHRHLNIATRAFRETRTELHFPDGSVRTYSYRPFERESESAPWRDMALKDGAIVGSFPASAYPGPDVQVKCNVPIVVTLGEPGTVDDGTAPILDQMQALLDFVRQNVVPLFEPFF